MTAGGGKRFLPPFNKGYMTMSISKVSDISQLYADARTYSVPDSIASGSEGTSQQSPVFKKTYVPESSDKGDIKLKLSDAAGSISKADTAMNAIGGVLSEMKGQLEKIVKNYPPYPAGSSERVRMLKHFAALRKEIERLTIPPDDKEAAYILADPNRVPGAGDQEMTVDSSGRKMIIRSQPVHAGSNGLDIPELDVSATDEEIENAIEKMNTAESMLQSKRSALAGNLRINGA
jgi:hypothetical protein